MNDARRVAVARLDHVSRLHPRGSEVVHALDGVSLTLEPGEVVALLGPSGSGKSSLLHMLAGWEEPDEGEVWWADEVRSDTWAGLALVPQSLGLLDELSIRENVELPQRLAKAEDAGRVDALLDGLHLAHVRARQVDEVSMGEQQRAAVARGLVLRPRLFLADEPTSHQDRALVEEVFAHLRAAALTGTTVVVATHDPSGLERADRVVHMRDGRIEDVVAARSS
ncbi:MAG: putative transport system ATP-binding protein [Acidimicrobiaceae bacterium]|nr:putative transport system ATP-binding protein [Acidimicrobiaceae bacterium]